MKLTLGVYDKIKTVCNHGIVWLNRSRCVVHVYVKT